MSAVAEKEHELLRGGEWLVKTVKASDVFTPDFWNEEQENIAGMIDDFIKQEVWPKLEDMDSMEHPEIMPSLLKQAGELGILGISVPEEYGGFGLDSTTAMYATELVGKSHSFSVGLAAHTGIGMLPILYFGTKEQKDKYIPKLATGEWLASYCLTEPGSGSDALGAKTRADLTEDGEHYLINGQKMWITNAGFADIFILFAKIDGEKFTGFIVERDMDGITFNEEEKKMGIKGSSTRQMFFNDVKVPKENILGEIGKGHVIAFNILNIGRLKLGAAAIGAAKEVINHAVNYSNERKQFDQSISSFGAIKYKLAEQAIRVWTANAAVYRVTDYVTQLEDKLEKEGETYENARMKSAREYAVECAMMKVLGSEVLDYVVDEGVQVYGGYGFSEEFPMARAYRDSRINRIFEGTNEINRMLTLNDLFKKAMGGELDLMTPGQEIQKELMNGEAPAETPENGHPLARERAAVENFKKAVLMTAGSAAMKYQQELADHQEILLYLADMMIQTYTAESALLRAEKLLNAKGEEAADIAVKIVKVYTTDAAQRISEAGKNVVYAMHEDDEAQLKGMLSGLKRFTRVSAYNTIRARRDIANNMIEANKYTVA